MTKKKQKFEAGPYLDFIDLADAGLGGSGATIVHKLYRGEKLTSEELETVEKDVIARAKEIEPEDAKHVRYAKQQWKEWFKAVHGEGEIAGEDLQEEEPSLKECLQEAWDHITAAQEIVEELKKEPHGESGAFTPAEKTMLIDWLNDEIPSIAGTIEDDPSEEGVSFVAALVKLYEHLGGRKGLINMKALRKELALYGNRKRIGE